MATASVSQSSGQFSNTVSAMSPAESDGLNRNSFVLPLTSISRRFILSAGMFLDDIFRQSSATARPPTNLLSLILLLLLAYYSPPSASVVVCCTPRRLRLSWCCRIPHPFSPSILQENFDANCSSPVLSAAQQPTTKSKGTARYRLTTSTTSVNPCTSLPRFTHFPFRRFFTRISLVTTQSTNQPAKGALIEQHYKRKHLRIPTVPESEPVRTHFLAPPLEGVRHFPKRTTEHRSQLSAYT